MTTRPHPGKRDLGPLYDLLLEACPPSAGQRSIRILAAHLNNERTQKTYTAQGLYKVIQLGKITPKLAMQVVELSGGRVSIEDFHPFIFV